MNEHMQKIAETDGEHPAHVTQNWHTDVLPAFASDGGIK